jgi:hypothetical protein
MAFDLFEHDHGAPPRPVELEQHRGRFELGIDFVLDAQKLVGIFRLDHAQEATQALIVDIRKHCHGVPDAINGPFDCIAPPHGKGRLRLLRNFNENRTTER